MKIKVFYTISILSLSIFLLSTLTGWMNRPAPPDNKAIQQAVIKSLLLLQKSGYTFINNAPHNCASCHHNTLTAMAAEIAGQKGIPVVDSFSVYGATAMKFTLAGICNPNMIDQFVAANFIGPYVLLGLYAAKYPADFNTDISVDYLISQAKPDGSFLSESLRAPLESGDIHLTAMAIRAIQLYASAAKKQHVNELVMKTRQWLEKQNPSTQQELVFQLLGMHWCGSDEAHKTKVAGQLIARQNEDGGWSQLPTLKSDAYATGQALYSLYEGGMIKPEHKVYEKGSDYLLKTQDISGAWIVTTRSFPIQPFVDGDFPPYNYDQFISATATNWATMALLKALPDK
jgi:hypothetical protein